MTEGKPYKNIELGGGAVQWLKVFASLAEDIYLAPSTHIWQFSTSCNFRSKDSNILLASVGACTHLHIALPPLFSFSSSSLPPLNNFKV